jgi:hypothetical protein
MTEHPGAVNFPASLSLKPQLQVANDAGSGAADHVPNLSSADF